MARDQITFEKRRREMEKKRKAEEKRERRRQRKMEAEQDAANEAGEPEDGDAERDQVEQPELQDTQDET